MCCDFMCFTSRLSPGRILAVDSLFYYASGESYSTFKNKGFKPLFLEDVLHNMTDAERANAKATCGDNKECLFDFAVTGRYIYKLQNIASSYAIMLVGYYNNCFNKSTFTKISNDCIKSPFV